MNKALRYVFSFTYWFMLFWLSLSFLIFVLVIRPLTFLVDRDAKIINRISTIWGSLSVWMNPFWRLQIRHREILKPRTTYLLVSNHLSLFDPLVLFSLRTPFKWLVKQSAFKIPIVGWGMYVNRYIMVKRDSRKSRGEAMQICRHWLERGNSVLIFPEGTRSRTGELQAFQPGAFRLAAELSLPLVPMVVNGTQDILPKNTSFLVGSRAHLTIEILEPIPGGTYTIDQVDAFKAEVHQRMQKALAALRSEHPGAGSNPEVNAVGMVKHQR